jgi:Zn-finger nucleic acid-binding protein
MTERSGVEIDYCGVCRGVWLDRGELDKIIERAATPAPAPAPQRYAAPTPQWDDRRYHGSDSYAYKKKKKKKNPLSELFDF